MNKILLTVGLLFVVTRCAVSAPNNDERGDRKPSDEDASEESETTTGALFLNQVKRHTVMLIAGLNDTLNLAKGDCIDIDDKVTDAVDRVEKCISGMDLGTNTVCAFAKLTLEKCSKPITEVLGTCLPKESKELPLLVENIVFGITKQLCDTTIEELLEFFNQCQFKENISEFPSCREVLFSLRTYGNKFPTTEFVCSLIPKAKKCSSDVNSFYCKNRITINVFAKFYAMIEKETEGICHNLVKNEVV